MEIQGDQQQPSLCMDDGPHCHDRIQLIVRKHQLNVCGSDQIHFTGQLLSTT